MELSRFVTIVLLGGFAVVVSVKGDGQVSCGLYETQCEYGCCPYADAVCCSDGYECCQHGQICIPYIGICIGVQSNSDGNATLHSQKTTAVRSNEPCPNSTTTCPGGCCPFPEGVCCSDNIHCCPNEWSCTASGCASNGTTNPFLVGRIEGPVQLDNVIVLPSSSHSLKTCPDGKRQCPKGRSCCIGDNGDWNCCPAPPVSVTAGETRNYYDWKMERLENVSSPNSVPRLSTGECCNTKFGWVCCIDLIPKCYYFGCWWW